MKRVIEPNEILDAHQVAEVLGVSYRTVLRLSEAGRLPSNEKIGKRYYWTGEQVLNSVVTPSTMKPDSNK